MKLVAVMLVLCTAAVGCKKKPQNTTPLPGYGPGQVGDTTPKGPLTSTTPPRNENVAPVPAETKPITQPVPVTEGPGGFEQVDSMDKMSWPKDYETFSAQTVYFDFDKSNVKPGEVTKLETVAAKMKTLGADKALLIEGHADERGTEEYNRALGERRALEVRSTLIRLGLDPANVVTISYGEDRPAVPGHNEAVWAKNRRAQIVLLTKPAGPVTGGGAPK